jgi:glycosyltransferase involved in cell wall biosynthesis
MRLTFYCPDTHIEYTGTTPETVGVGGGVTARIHLARALARRGHDVVAVVNCPGEEVIDGARFVPVGSVSGVTGDVVVLNTSGGGLTLVPALALEITTECLVLWVHGISPIGGRASLRFDTVVVPSGFIASVVEREWGYPRSLVEVIPNGFERYPVGQAVERNPHRLAYTSHPEKGLTAALEVLRTLRAEDPRYEMHLYGGAELWGQAAVTTEGEGVTDHGLVPQPTIAEELHRASFALHLQAIPEAFSISLSEAMAAGAIVVASPVGALAERIANGRNGVLVRGDHLSDPVIRRAAREIVRLTAHPRRAAKIRRQAAAAVLDWDQVAELWERRFADR